MTHRRYRDETIDGKGKALWKREARPRKGKRRMLKNDKERMAYVKAPESWEELERSKLSALDGNPVFKLQRLKGTRILRLAAYAGPKSRCPGNYVPIDTFITDESGARSFAHSSMSDTLLVTLLRKGKAE